MGENAAKKRPSASGRARKRRPAVSPAPRKPRPRPAPEVESPAAAPAFPIVGVGASAGGLEAFTQLLAHIPEDSGMAFVFIQHLDPNHASLLDESLARATRLKVVRAENGMPVKPNQVYVIPPDADLGIAAGRLTLQPRQTPGSRLAPADRRLLSLAGGRTPQPGHRRGAVRHRLRRHRGPAGDQGRRWHHLRPGSPVRQVRRHAGQRRAGRGGRPLSAHPPTGPGNPAPGRPPVPDRASNDLARQRRSRIPTDPRAGRQDRGRELRRAQAADARAPAEPTDGGARSGRAWPLTWRC